MNLNPKYTPIKIRPKNKIGFKVSFFKPNFPYNNVAAKDNESADDSRFNVEINIMTPNTIKMEED